MSTRHQLAIDVLDTAQPGVLRLSDASLYASLLHVDCPQLDVLVPGATSWVYLTTELPKGFIRTVGASELRVQKTAEATPLPDGVYVIGYSVSPNDKTRVERLHLRTTQLTNRLYQALATLQASECEPTAEQNRHLLELRRIQLYLQGAVAQAEVCQNRKQATQLYDYARLLLERYISHHCPTCTSC